MAYSKFNFVYSVLSSPKDCANHITLPLAAPL